MPEDPELARLAAELERLRRRTVQLGFSVLVLALLCVWLAHRVFWPDAIRIPGPDGRSAELTATGLRLSSYGAPLAELTADKGAVRLVLGDDSSGITSTSRFRNAELSLRTGGPWIDLQSSQETGNSLELWTKPVQAGIDEPWNAGSGKRPRFWLSAPSGGSALDAKGVTTQPASSNGSR